LSAIYESEVLADLGRAFQAHAVATENAVLPNVLDHRVVNTSRHSVDVDPELQIALLQSNSISKIS